MTLVSESATVRTSGWPNQWLIIIALLGVHALYSFPESAQTKLVKTDTDLISIVTDAHDIVFSRVGAVPVLWRVTVDTGTSSEKEQSTATIVDRLSSDIINVARPLALYEGDSESKANIFAEFNESKFSVRRDDGEKYTTVWFESSSATHGVKLTNIYRVPIERLPVKLTLILPRVRSHGGGST